MQKIIRTPHDRFSRTMLRDQRVARAFFEAHLPSHILQRLDLDTLELTKESFVDEKLKLVITDILFKVQWEQKPGYLYLLIEAQSRAERFMPLRAIKYQIEALDNHVKNTGDKTLPVIYCLVLYNGKRQYNEPIDFFELFGENQELARGIFQQPFQLIDLTQIPDEEIRHNLWRSIGEGCLKHIWDRDVLPFLQSMMPLFQRAEKENAQALVQAAIYYLIAAGDVGDPQVFEKTIEQNLSAETGEIAMATMAHYYLTKGRQEGIQQGKQEGLQQGKQQGEYNLLIRLLECKFKNIPTHLRQQLAQANTETLLKISERILEAHNLEDIFA